MEMKEVDKVISNLCNSINKEITRDDQEKETTGRILALAELIHAKANLLQAQRYFMGRDTK